MYDPKAHILLQEILKKEEVSDDQFKARLFANFSVVRNHLRALYGDREDLPQILQQITETLISFHQQRSVERKQTDCLREQNPGWFLSEKIVGMMLYVDLFNDDLKGLIEKIDYFEELGVNFIHLMPVLKVPKDHNDGGYAVSDYRQIDSKFGTKADFRKVSKAFRKRGIYLMLDIVINHTSDEHEWAIKAKQGDPKYQDYYYFFKDRYWPDQYEQSMPEVFPDSSPGNFTFIPEVDQWVMSVFNTYQWDLNYTNPQVFVEMLSNLLYLSNEGADVLRLDALAFMWKKLGTTSQNLDEAHQIIRTFKACMQITCPGTIFLAEAIVAPQEIIKYFGETDTVTNECDLAYNATLMTLLWESVATKNNRLTSVSIQNVPQKPFGTSWITYLRCHDDIGLGYEDEHARWAGYDAHGHRHFIINFLTGSIDWSFARGRRFMEDPEKGDARISGSLASLAGLEKALEQGDDHLVDLAISRILMLHAIVLSYGGIPMLYMGDELGLLNDYTYELDPAKVADNRWMHRPKMNWEKASNRSNNHSVEGRIYLDIQHMIQVRKQISQFRDQNNTYLIDFGNQHVLGFIRYNSEGKVVCIFNLNDHEEWIPLDILKEQGIDVGSGIKDQMTGDKVGTPYDQIRLKPYQFHWISEQQLEKSKNPQEYKIDDEENLVEREHNLSSIPQEL
ncbi:MAG: alpha-amylase family protein [Cytophagales bacterium]|nr:alpha-amylase family protein [Cytophagales bacterium]